MRKSTVLRLRERYFKNKKAATIEETFPYSRFKFSFRLVGMVRTLSSEKIFQREGGDEYRI